MNWIENLRRKFHFNRRYLGSPPWDTGVSPPELIAFLENARPGVALDVGCGTGTNLLSLARAGWQVMGVDVACLAVLQARRRLKKASVPGKVFLRDAGAPLELPCQFNFVLDMGCFHNLSQPERRHYRDNLKRWLLPGGVYLLYAHRPRTDLRHHGVGDADLAAFSSFLTLTWQQENAETRPDGGGGYPAVWVRFDRLDSHNANAIR